MSRYCPNCGAIIPPNSLNCPHCYTEVPREMQVNERDHIRQERSPDEFKEQLNRRHKSRVLSLVLAVIPAFFGILGLAQIYQDRRDPKGYQLLAIGLVLFIAVLAMVFMVAATALLASILLAVPILIATLLYILTAIVSIVDAVNGSFGLFGFKN